MRDLWDSDLHVVVETEYPRHAFGVAGRLNLDRGQKELDPTRPITIVGNGSQASIVLIAMRLEILGQVEHRAGENLLLKQEQRN